MNTRSSGLSLKEFLIKILTVVGAASLAVLALYYFGLEPLVHAQDPAPSQSTVSQPQSAAALPTSAAPLATPPGAPILQNYSEALPNTTGTTSPADIGLGERDPFRPPTYIIDIQAAKNRPPPQKREDVIDDRIEAIRRWPIKEYRLIGIIWGVASPKAMIVDKLNTMHLLKKNYRIGNKDGVITSITEGSIVVMEENVPIVLRIQSAPTANR